MVSLHTQTTPLVLDLGIQTDFITTDVKLHTVLAGGGRRGVGGQGVHTQGAVVTASTGTGTGGYSGGGGGGGSREDPNLFTLASLPLQPAQLAQQQAITAQYHSHPYAYELGPSPHTHTHTQGYDHGYGHRHSDGQGQGLSRSLVTGSITSNASLTDSPSLHTPSLTLHGSVAIASVAVGAQTAHHIENSIHHERTKPKGVFAGGGWSTAESRLAGVLSQHSYTDTADGMGGMGGSYGGGSYGGEYPLSGPSMGSVGSSLTDNQVPTPLHPTPPHSTPLSSRTRSPTLSHIQHPHIHNLH